MINYKLFCFFGVAACTIILTFIPSANSIMCYECNSKVHANCSSKIPSSEYKKDCSTSNTGLPYKMCRKIVQTIDFEVNGLKPDHRVIRSCAYEPPIDESKECYQRSGFGGRQEVCTCKTDLCNNSNNIKINSSILLASFSILCVFSKLLS